MQAGKSFVGYVLLCIWHLFEVGETVVLGLPDAGMSNDKWSKDILPVIQASRYKSLLPERGQGSRNGIVKTEVTFQNGATLRFMTGGGGDASRSGYTSRVSAITESDKMDSAGGGSKETDKAAQIQARTDAFGDQAYLYVECTPSYETGMIWREYTQGSHTRIACPCPHCSTHVTPEREHLVGWQDAPTEIDARERARWVCPACGAVLTEADRITMNRAAVPAHRGQQVRDDGVVEGDRPRTLTFGFRFNAFNNLFWTAQTVAAREWKLARKSDEDAAERESLQFLWGRPAKPVKLDLTALEATVIAARIAAVPYRQVPVDADRLTLGIDVGKWLIHFTVLAWRTNASAHVVEYGRVEVPSEVTTEELAILNALRRLRDETAAAGWPSAVDPEGKGIRPVMALVDARWNTDAVMAFCSESPGFMASEGFGYGQRGAGNRGQRTTGAKVVASGDHYDLVRNPDGTQYLDVDANHWKSWLHQRLKTPIGEPGAVTLYQMARNLDGRPSGDHLKFARHLLAERQVQEVVKGVPVTRFEVLSRNNHWLDSTTLACVAGHVAGVRLIRPELRPTAAVASVGRQVNRPSFLPGRP